MTLKLNTSFGIKIIITLFLLPTVMLANSTYLSDLILNVFVNDALPFHYYIETTGPVHRFVHLWGPSTWPAGIGQKLPL